MTKLVWVVMIRDISGNFSGCPLEVYDDLEDANNRVKVLDKNMNEYMQYVERYKSPLFYVFGGAATYHSKD